MTDTTFILSTVRKGEVTLSALLLLNICKLLLVVKYTVKVTGIKKPQIPLQGPKLCVFFF